MRPFSSAVTRGAALAFAVLGLAVAQPAPCPAAEPTALVGTWTWTWKDGENKTHKHVLDIEAVAGKLTARERFDEEDSIKVDDLKLKGDDVTFSVRRGDRFAEYKGKLVGDKTINGLVNVTVEGQPKEFQWTAERALAAK